MAKFSESKAPILAAFTMLCVIIMTAYILRSNDVKPELPPTPPSLVEVANSPPENTLDESPKIIKETEAEVIINLTEPDTFEEPPSEALPEMPDTISGETPALQSPESLPPQTTPPATRPSPSPPQSSAPVPGSTNNNGEFYDPVFGWVKPGEVVVTHIDSDGDINKMVGSMG